MLGIRGLLLLTTVAVVSACAGVTAKNDGGSKDKGIRYYEPRPFILVHTDSKGGLTSKLIWLPDTRQIRTIRPYAVTAKNNATFTFSNGVLTQAKSVVDETAVPAAIIGALKSSAIAAANAALNDVKDDEQELPAPVLYAIDVNSAGAWALTEATVSPDKIKLVLVKQPKEEKK